MMSKKRVSNRTASEIAERRISILLEISGKAAEEGRPDRAKRYVALAKLIGQRTKVRMPDGAMFCDRCDMPLKAGRNCRVRVTSGRIRRTCLECGDVRRMPYTREQRR